MFTNKCRNECYKSYLGITQILRNKYKKAVDPSHVNELPIFQYASSEPKTHKRIYTWGVAAHGAQGDGEFVRPKNRSIQPKLAVKRPHRLEFGEFHDVKDVSCGYGFSVFAVKSKDNNKVFGCGLNATSQIGYQSARKGAPLEILLEPVPISIPYINPSETRVRSVACGRAHTVVATDEGVFTLGHNGYGQCGRRIIPNEEYFGSKIVHKVPELQDLDVTDVVCGQDHSIFLCKTGKVLACGWSADGQTGVSHYDNQEEPAEVMGDIQGEKIVKVATSADCVLAINGNGDLFGWGNNEYGQLNSATEDMQLNVSRILKLPPYVGKIIDIAVGGTVCIILNGEYVLFFNLRFVQPIICLEC
ncbi:hypothetical protein QYM36_004148 [Artemia franciscana]|uniref:RCC1-like domain-containing protein n=1 Tax=Artemia franciscana TaxID=6661 RepID=A0AA88I5A8_ARTSF|nr:hypothetical protein QYM36_004148 [Artemia franciscana]